MPGHQGAQSTNACDDAFCGDGICNADEDGDNCCEDCGQCAAHGCPDVCECDDFCCTNWDDICEAECAGTSCGNDFCEPCEDEASCPEDCLVIDPFCGEGMRHAMGSGILAARIFASGRPRGRDTVRAKPFLV